MMSATKANAAGQENRPEASECGRVDGRSSFTRDANVLSSLSGLDLSLSS